MNQLPFVHIPRSPVGAVLTLGLLGAALVGCPSDKGSDSGKTLPAGAIELVDSNNYSLSGTISITQVEVQPETDLTIDWCGLTTDIRDRPVTDVADVDQVLLGEFALSQADIMDKVRTNDLDQGDMQTSWVIGSPGACSVKASEAEIAGNTFDPESFVVAANRTWLFSVLNLPDGRFDILMSVFVVPKEGSTNTTVVLTDDSMDVNFVADLSEETIKVGEGEIPYIDWSQVKKDVYGNDFDSLLGNRLLIGKIPVASVAEVESLFLRLDTEAEKLYYMDVYGSTQADLALATTKSGQAFQGFSSDGVWLLGVECLTCTSPAPLILTVVEVE